MITPFIFLLFSKSGYEVWESCFSFIPWRMGRRNGWGGESCGVENIAVGSGEAGLVRSAAAGRDRRRRGAGGGDRGESCESAKLRKSCV